MTALATITGGKIYLNTKYKSKVKKMKKNKKNTEHSKTQSYQVAGYISTHTLCNASIWVLSVCVSVCVSVCTDQAGFWHTGFYRLTLYCYEEIRYLEQ